MYYVRTKYIWTMRIHLPLPPVPIQRCSSVYFTTYNEYEGYEVSLYYPILIKLFSFLFFFFSVSSELSLGGAWRC